MNTQWFYSEDGAQYGPVDESEIIRRIQAGEMPPGTPVCMKGSMDWQPARNHACFQVEIFPQTRGGTMSGTTPDPQPPPEEPPYQHQPPTHHQPAHHQPTGYPPAGTSPGQGYGQGYGQALPPQTGMPGDAVVISEYEEGSVRTRHCMLIGVALLFGAICPIILKNPFSGEYKFIFTLFGPEGMESSAVVAQWLVLIAGIVILALSGPSHDAYRGGVMIGIAGLNVILGFTTDDTFKNLMKADGEMTTVAIVILGMVFCWWGLMAGGRSRHLRPHSDGARVVGMLGGIVMLVLLVLPVLPEKVGSVFLMLPFKAMGEGDDGTTAGLLMLALMAMIIASAILCIINSNLKTPERSSRLGQNAFQLASLIVPSIFVIVLVNLFKAAGEFPPLWAIINILKIYCILAGAVYLMPIGISEAIVGARRA